jgi:hypothetical protein
MFEADNGAVYALNVQSVSHPRYCGGCADAVICVLDNDQCHAPNVKQIRFDCQGHYMDMFGGGGMQIAPPRSVLGRWPWQCVLARSSLEGNGPELVASIDQRAGKRRRYPPLSRSLLAASARWARLAGGGNERQLRH